LDTTDKSTTESEKWEFEMKIEREDDAENNVEPTEAEVAETGAGQEDGSGVVVVFDTDHHTQAVAIDTVLDDPDPDEDD